MTTQHTAGPWRIGDAGTTIFGPPNGNPSPRTVAKIMQHPRFHKGLEVLETNEDKANAHLIAAAPELLQALQYLVNEIQLSRLNIRKNFSLINAHACASKAIFKAKGGTP